MVAIVLSQVALTVSNASILQRVSVFQCFSHHIAERGVKSFMLGPMVTNQSLRVIGATLPLSSGNSLTDPWFPSLPAEKVRCSPFSLLKLTPLDNPSDAPVLN